MLIFLSMLVSTQANMPFYIPTTNDAYELSVTADVEITDVEYPEGTIQQYKLLEVLKIENYGEEIEITEELIEMAREEIESREVGK